MRNEQEMMDLILTFAKNDECIRVVTMEGSKLNKNAPIDKFQDYDIAFHVTDMEKYKSDEKWLDIFGKRIMMQKPEAMPLFPPVWLGESKRFSYLLVFEDGNKMDLGLSPLNELKLYFDESDSLVKVLLDKDNICPAIPEPSDVDFLVKKPSEEFLGNCCNEFWFLAIYVTKGLCRKELLYAIKHLDLMRAQMLTMASWKVGIETSFSVSVGKSYKYLDKFVSGRTWEAIIKTYKNDSIDSVWDSLIMCCNLFQEFTNYVSAELKYKIPEYNNNVIKYIKQFIPKNKLGSVKIIQAKGTYHYDK